MMFYKFISNTQIKKVKFPLNIDDKIIFSSDTAELAQYGIYPLVETPMPIEYGYYATPKYRIEDNKIVKEWELIPLPLEEEQLNYEQAYNELNTAIGGNSNE